MFQIKTHILPGQYIREYPAAILEDQEDTLQLHIKQYIPRGASWVQTWPITIIGAHGNGFPKELYEPMWEELCKRLEKVGVSIRSIWIADAVHQGQSFVLNEDKLGNDPSWLDHSRDLLHIINHFRKEMPRPLVGIGHSMGGGQLVNLSIMHPRLLSSLVLIDPPVGLPAPARCCSVRANFIFAKMSAFRRDLWSSRAEAAASFKNNKLYQSWDERVFDRWIEHGLRELPTAMYPEHHPRDSTEIPVTLTTSKHQEVFTFARPNFEGRDAIGNPIVNRQTHPDIDPESPQAYPFYRSEPPSTFLCLPHLRPSVLYIFGGQSAISHPDLRRQKMERTGTGVGGSGGAKEGRVIEVVFENSGHLIPMDTPNECAQAVADFLAPEMQRWRQEEAEFREKWSKKGKEEKTMLTDEWRRLLGGDPRAKPPPSKF